MVILSPKNHISSFWGLFDRIKANVPLINNSLEAYNRYLNKVAETNHPSLNLLIFELKKESEPSSIEILSTRFFSRNKFEFLKI